MTGSTLTRAESLLITRISAGDIVSFPSSSSSSVIIRGRSVRNEIWWRTFRDGRLRTRLCRKRGDSPSCLDGDDRTRIDHVDTTGGYLNDTRREKKQNLKSLQVYVLVSFTLPDHFRFLKKKHRGQRRKISQGKNTNFAHRVCILHVDIFNNGVDLTLKFQLASSWKSSPGVSMTEKRTLSKRDSHISTQAVCISCVDLGGPFKKRSTAALWSTVAPGRSISRLKQQTEQRRLPSAFATHNLHTKQITESASGVGEQKKRGDRSLTMILNVGGSTRATLAVPACRSRENLQVGSRRRRRHVQRRDGTVITLSCRRPKRFMERNRDIGIVA
jgi:hypothetical protein